MNPSTAPAIDPRAPVLELLRAYAACTTDREQSRTAVAMIDFVQNEAGCLWRSCVPGHLTGSAWIVSPDRTRVLLTHHRKLDK
ncbi:MAG: hypothetical protein RIQ93_1671, partial [Verrucomicrobiota bacterium]